MSSVFRSKVQAKTVAVVGAVRPDLLAAAKVRATKTFKGVRAQNGVRGRTHHKKVVKAARPTKRSK